MKESEIDGIGKSLITGVVRVQAILRLEPSQQPNEQEASREAIREELSERYGA